MSKLNMWRTSPLLRLGLSITLGLIFLISMLLTISAIHPPDVAQAQVTTEEEVTNIYNEPSTAQAPFTTVVTITPTAISHKLSGIGVHMFDSDYLSPTFTSTLKTLGLTYLRVPFGPDWTKVVTSPPACNEMYDFIEKNFNRDTPVPPYRLENAKAISDIAEDLGIKIIFLNWQAPFTSWLTDQTKYRELKAEHVDDYACFVTAVVKYLTDEGVKISYLEPTNEPSITHNTKIPPELYNTFVTTLSERLAISNLSEIEILGPGLAYLNHHSTGITWVQALDDNGVAAISVWAAHAWDPEFPPKEPEVDRLRTKWEEFYPAIKEKDPSKPIFITEYACVNDPSNGICAVENTLTLLDQGANAVVYWYLREQYWDLDWKNWERALLTENYCEKPTFTALTSVLPFISGDEVKVLEAQIEGRITSVSFYEADNGLGQEQVTVALVNSYLEPEHVWIDITGAVTVADGAIYSGDTQAITKDLGFVQCQTDSDRTQCQLSLQPNTIATLVFKEPNQSLLYHVYLPLITSGPDICDEPTG